MSNQDIHDVWYDYALKFVDKKNKQEQGWSGLTSEEQEIAALWLLEVDVYNGGFIQFFCNWGEEAYLHVLRALHTIGANQVLGNIQEQYRLIEHLADDERLTALWDIPRLLTTEEELRLDTLDQRLWDNEDQIAEKAYTYYHRKLIIEA